MSPDPLVPRSSLRHVLSLLIAGAGLVMGMVAIPWIVRLEGAQWLAASLATAGMCGLTVQLATRNPARSGGGLSRTVPWAVLMGLANVPVSFLAASAALGPDPHMIPMAGLASIVGAPFGLGLGLLFGLVLSVPVGAFVRAWQRPSPHATDFMLVVGGAWLAIAVGLASILETPTIRPEATLLSGGTDPSQSAVLHLFAWVLGTLGLGLAIAAGLRQAARRRFVARVARGLVPEWRLAEAPPQRAHLEHLPCLGEIVDECEHLLMRCESSGDGAYRRATTEWPVAWVPPTWVSRALLTRA